MNNFKNLELGKKGEELAARYLIKKGYKIRHKNWRYRHEELDIVAFYDKQLIVVEVKSRTSDFYEHPHDAVTLKKQKYIIDATEAYIQKYDIHEETRFDVISVVFSKQSYTIDHIEDAFTPQF